ncbi:MAG: hypothetical protein N2485_04360 [bacterium]|mgnify:FL=1|nr:hypothetical protein [bacterium]
MEKQDNFYIGWINKIPVKFKTEYELVMMFSSISFYPVKASLKLYLIKDQEKIEINSIKSLEDKVLIDNEESALDFVRLFTKPELHVFFDLYAIEVFKKGENPFEPYGSVDEDFYLKYNLKPAKVLKENHYFIVERFLMFYPDDEGIIPKRIALVKEYVYPNGKYENEIINEIYDPKIDLIKTPID